MIAPLVRYNRLYRGSESARALNMHVCIYARPNMHIAHISSTSEYIQHYPNKDMRKYANSLILSRSSNMRESSNFLPVNNMNRLNVIKALSSTSFGHSKESQTVLYKQFILPVLSYASPAWAPDLARSHMEVMQRIQNAALRIATCCVRSIPTAHLHEETKVLPSGTTWT